MIFKSKPISLVVVLLVYIIAALGGIAVFRLTPFDPVWAFLCADAAATVIVWAFGLIFKNASLYDPYWSVAPPILFAFFLSQSQIFDAAGALYIAVLAFWGVRLTLNWIVGWNGLQQQDWRYTMLRQKNKALWPLTNFFGINMMPTLIVFVNMLPAYYSTLTLANLGFLTVVGALICIGAVVVQVVSDRQMRLFRNDPANKNLNMESGLWRFSRHPNYLGEVSFWWGIYIMMLGQIPSHWWMIISPILMTLLFVFISIPMMEKRLLATKKGYADYQKSTSMLLPMPRKSVLFDECDSKSDSAVL